MTVTIRLPHHNWVNPGNYRAALQAATAGFARRDPNEMARSSGAEFSAGERALVVTAFNHQLVVSYPDGRVTFRGTEAVPDIALQIVAVNYLARADGTPLANRMVPYREIPWGHAFDPAFRKFAIEPIIDAFGTEPCRFIDAARPYGGMLITEKGKVEIYFYLFPRVPVLYQLWPADDELPASANILFDASTPHYLHVEDAVIVSYLTQRLVIEAFPGRDFGRLWYERRGW